MLKMTWPVAERIERNAAALFLPWGHVLLGVGGTLQTDKRSTSLQRKVCLGIKLKPKLVPEKVRRRLSLTQLFGSHFVTFQPFLISEQQAHMFHFFMQHCQESVAITLCSLPYFIVYITLPSPQKSMYISNLHMKKLRPAKASTSQGHQLRR